MLPAPMRPMWVVMGLGVVSEIARRIYLARPRKQVLRGGMTDWQRKASPLKEGARARLPCESVIGGDEVLVGGFVGFGSGYCPRAKNTVPDGDADILDQIEIQF